VGVERPGPGAQGEPPPEAAPGGGAAREPAAEAPAEPGPGARGLPGAAPNAAAASADGAAAGEARGLGAGNCALDVDGLGEEAGGVREGAAREGDGHAPGRAPAGAAAKERRRRRQVVARAKYNAEKAARAGNGYVEPKMVRARLLHDAILRLLGAPPRTL
jgi:hypothetical protein